jgi:hypothetical protein
MNGEDGGRSGGIGFADFRRLALDPALSAHEKIGFPDAYREGFEAAIHDDIAGKVPALRRAGALVLDIGPGCAGLPRRFIDDARRLGQQLHLVDCGEMLDLLPEASCARKTAARYPDCPELLGELAGRVDVVVAYSVIQYVHAEGDLWRFLDATLPLLAPGGRVLLGDVPNASMRHRFFSSDAGRAYHREFTGRDGDPAVEAAAPAGTIDDAVVLGIVQRARSQGFHGFVLPQPPGLPMHNRREDVLIVRP